MNFIKLPNGDYLNLNLIEKVKFASPEDAEQIKHLVCQLDCIGDTLHYRDDDAIFLKDYFDKNCGDFLQVHELDHAVQVVGLGVAVQIIEDLTGNSVQNISLEIIEIANKQVAEMTPQQVKQIRRTYEDDSGKGISGTLGRINLAA